MLIGNLNEPYMDRTDKDVQDQIDTIVKYMHDHRGTHGRYAFRFFLCEVWNFVNVIVQIYFIDFFLGGEFQTYVSFLYKIVLGWFHEIFNKLKNRGIFRYYCDFTSFFLLLYRDLMY